jgi:hypothetical protein
MLSSLFGVGWLKRPCDGWSEEARIEEAGKRKTHPCMNQNGKDGHPRYRGHSKFMQSRSENTMKVEIVHCPT